MTMTKRINCGLPIGRLWCLQMGSIDREGYWNIKVPAKNVTSCAFGAISLIYYIYNSQKRDF